MCTEINKYRNTHSDIVTLEKKHTQSNYKHKVTESPNPTAEAPRFNMKTPFQCKRHEKSYVHTDSKIL